MTKFFQFSAAIIILVTLPNSAICKENDPVSARYSKIDQQDDKLDSEISRFLGKARNKNSAQEGSVSDQIIAHISEPDEPFSTRLPSGNWILTGNLPGDGGAKGGVLINSAGKIVAACLFVYVGQKNLEPKIELWIYTPRSLKFGDNVSDVEGHFRKYGNHPIRVIFTK